MAIEFTDNSLKVSEEINRKIEAALYECGMLVESNAKQLSRVDTGQLKNSWSHKVDIEEGTCVIGSPLQNAIWEEFGTGEYALHGDGRKTPWVYRDIDGNYHRTTGKKPARTLKRAIDGSKDSIERVFEEKFK